MNKNFFVSFPSVIRIEPSSLCNLKCSHCPTGTLNMKRGAMSEDIFNIVLEQLKANLETIKVVVLYHGGEPLMNIRFPYMVSKIKSLGIPYVKTVSNGMLLNGDLIERVEWNNLDCIEFSLDGESLEENNVIRRGCDGQKVIENIKALISYKKNNNLQKPDIYISTTQFIKNKDSNKYKVPDYLYDNFKQEIQEKQIKEFKVSIAMEWPKMKIIDNMYEVYTENKANMDNYCDHIINTITIRWNGDIVPCCYDLTSEYVVDNILNNDLKTIWNSERYISIRENIFNRTFNSLCYNCNTVKNKKFLIKKIHKKNRWGDDND